MERIRCSVCGKFIAYKDLHNGKAIWEMVLPDSELSVETWEGFCPKHNQRKNNETKKGLR